LWRDKISKKLTRGAWAMWCAMGKFSNFEFFSTNSKMFEKFPAYSKKMKIFSPIQKIWQRTYP
jgi:hypothetical protein